MQHPDYYKNTFVDIEPLIKLAETAKLDKDERIKKCLLAVGVSNDLRLRNDIQRIMSFKAVYELLEKFPFSEPCCDISNLELLKEKFIILGKVKRKRNPFFYPFNLLNQHMLILGSTGTGKTNLMYGVILQAMKQNVPVWVFDKDKQDYRHLRRFDSGVSVFNVQTNLCYNPLQVPKNVKPEHRIAIFITIFCRTNDLLIGSESLLTKAFYELYERFGVLKGQDSYPTFIDLYEKIKSYNFRGNSRTANFQDSILNRLEAYITTNKKMYEYSKGYPVEELAKRNIVFEVKGLSEKIARFVMNILVYDLFLYRIASGQRGNILRNLVVIDEAKWLAPPGYNKNLSFSPLTYILAQGREAGIGLVLADQSASLDDAVFVNSRIKICFRLGSGKDIETARQTMAFSKEQADYITKLDTGECIVRIPKEDAFLLETLKVKIQ